MALPSAMGRATMFHARVTSSFSLAVFIKLAVLAMAGFLLSVGAEVVRE